MTEETQNTVSEEVKAPTAQFALQKIYVKDISFETPMDISARSQAQPAVQQDLNTQINKVGEQHFEVVLKLTITVKQEENVAFLAEVHQAGLFLVTGLEGPKLQQTLSTVAPSILFPYAREAIDSLAIRGGFPPLMLPPLNFDNIYVRAMAEAKAKAAAGQTSPEAH
ncbi:MAG: preprotein translocase subunit SecB [Lentisphaeria bacterium]|jgi:preprotein translocase subunit SecB